MRRHRDRDYLIRYAARLIFWFWALPAFGLWSCFLRSFVAGDGTFWTLLALLTGVSAVVIVTAFLREASETDADRRRRRGICTCCGYNVRASPGRCPECGTPFERMR